MTQAVPLAVTLAVTRASAKLGLVVHDGALARTDLVAMVQQQIASSVWQGTVWQETVTRV